ncbi:MAG: hypothetical protein OXH65_03290 [Paracoccaceae bacterium]|nr:hypothetical protein [Paracoccaceae bacterium]MDE2674114.1 hypothetical protein [Paracoccaceae bacterium]
MVEHYGITFPEYNLDHEWEDISGVYIFAKELDKDLDLWEYLYVGETDSFQSRPISPRHEKWAEALELGMTHILAGEETDKHIRKWAEEYIIKTEKPYLNVQFNND